MIYEMRFNFLETCQIEEKRLVFEVRVKYIVSNSDGVEVKLIFLNFNIQLTLKPRSNKNNKKEAGWENQKEWLLDWTRR